MTDFSNSDSDSPVGYLQARDALIRDPATTYWLRNGVATLEMRDPVDALKDAEILLYLAQLRLAEILHTAADAVKQGRGH